MKIIFNRGNEYFDTYYIYNEQGQRIGVIEDHCREVKQQYFVGWKLYSHNKGEAEPFNTIEEAMIYSVGEVISF